MAIRSMTGFGRATVTLGGTPHAVEARSVNHRYLDVKIRLPRGLGAAEALIRRQVAAVVQRGRVEINISGGADDGAGPSRLEVNHPLAQQLRAAHAELAERVGVPDTLDTAQLAAFPGVLRMVPLDQDPAAIEASLAPALAVALDGLTAMRTREGEALFRTLVGHLDTLDGYRHRLMAGAPAQVTAYRERLVRRLTDWLDTVDVAVEPGRVLHEVALFADKVDVTEELARLEMHLEQARGLLAGPPEAGVGRQLDFLCQELLREVNTSGSKVQDAQLTEIVVAMKAELERLREQVQNVE